MTKSECLQAISNAFGGADVSLSDGMGNVGVKTSPPREVILTTGFVAAHIDVDGMTVQELTAHIAAMPAERWDVGSEGVPYLALVT